MISDLLPKEETTEEQHGPSPPKIKRSSESGKIDIASLPVNCNFISLFCAEHPPKL
jgi:hypothetical protein